MRRWQVIHLLAIITLIACGIQPVLAADDATTYYNTGEVLLERSDYEGAIASFAQALASDTTMMKKSDGLL